MEGIKSLKEATITYPDKEGVLKTRDVFVIKADAEDLFTLSLEGMDEDTKKLLLYTADTLNKIIKDESKKHFRRFKVAKLVPIEKEN